MTAKDSRANIDEEIDGLGSLDVDFQDFEDDDRGESR
jgi:hypothetical protein